MPKSKKLNKGKVRRAKKRASAVADAWAQSVQDAYRDWIYPSVCGIKKPTKAQLAKWAKERKAEERKEAKRRAKKITMTVGELEDKISEAEDRYRYDY